MPSSSGDVLAAIESGQLDPIYALAGAERYLVDRCVVALRAAVLGPNAGTQPGFNYDVFELKEAGLGTVLATARTIPMFAKRRLVIGRGADLLKSDDLEPLIGYAADPNPTACLVLMTDKADKIDGRLRAWAAIRKAGYLHEFGRLRGAELARWVAREGERRGTRLASDAAAALAETAGPDLGRLAQAIEQVALYAGEGVAVTRAHVEALIPESREREIWELTRALGEGNRNRALHLVGALLRDGEAPLRIQGSLVRQLRQTWRAKELLAQGVPRAEIAGRIGVPPFALDEVLGPARQMSAGALRRGFERLYQADRMLKSSKLPDELLVTRLVRALVDDASERTTNRRA